MNTYVVAVYNKKTQTNEIRYVRAYSSEEVKQIILGYDGDENDFIFSVVQDA